MIYEICFNFKIPIKINKTEKTITFENKSYIKVSGSDADDKQIDKALGGKYKLAIFDECQSITHDLEYWIRQKLGPAMVDLDGTIIMMGTAGNMMGEKFWYRVTKQDGPREPGWSVHSWTRYDNPHMKDKIEEHIQKELKHDPDFLNSQEYQQEWLCNWISDPSGRIYRYNAEKNALKEFSLMESLCKPDLRRWKYILGFDTGYEDDTAIVIGAYSYYDKCFYIVESFKKPKMLIDDIAELFFQFIEKYHPTYIVGDGTNKTLIETLRQKHGIPIQSAKKLGKEAHIAFMNSDFRKSKIKVIEDNNKALIKEWAELTSDENKRTLGIFKENPTKDNHLADACLYLHHFSKHFRATEEPKMTDEEHRIQHVITVARKENLMEDNSIYEHIDNMDFVANYKRNI